MGKKGRSILNTEQLGLCIVHTHEKEEDMTDRREGERERGREKAKLLEISPSQVISQSCHKRVNIGMKRLNDLISVGADLDRIPEVIHKWAF